jgi:hypothetical protein
MQDTLAQVQRRARAYWFADGLNEILAGLFALLLGGLLLLESRVGRETPQAQMLSSIVTMVLAMGALGLPFLLRWMKERLTYPRSGYVAHPDLRPAERLRRLLPGLGIALVLLVLLAASFIASPRVRLFSFSALLWFPAAFAFLFALLMYRTAHATGLRRQYLLSALSLAMAGYLTWRSWPLMTGLSPDMFEGNAFSSMPAEIAALTQSLMTALLAHTGLLLMVIGAAVLLLGIVARYRYLLETRDGRPE